MKQLNPFYWLGVFWARFNYKRNFRIFRKECQRAENLSADKNGKRFRVYKSTDGRYQSLCAENITYLKNRGAIRTKTDMGVISKHCLYDTQTHTNLHPVYLNVDLKLKVVTGRDLSAKKEEK